jgi:hypothetical protein
VSGRQAAMRGRRCDRLRSDRHSRHSETAPRAIRIRVRLGWEVREPLPPAREGWKRREVVDCETSLDLVVEEDWYRGNTVHRCAILLNGD